MMNVFVVEDSEAMRESLRSMLSEFHDVRIAGYAADETGAIEQINALLPDVVILDLNLLSGSGIAVLKNVKKHHAGIKVMVLTNCNDEFYVDACKRAHADFFFDKSFQFMQVREVFADWEKAGVMDNKQSD
jgi:DNA-binding NarL/FixJ family response regulator